MRLLIFGDSITEGYYDLKNGGWVNLLKVHFWKKNSLAKVVNLGISGDRILNVINRLENWINPYTEKSDNEIILIFAIGINDTITNLGGENLENTKYGFNSYLKKLLLISKNYTDNICFIGPTNVDENIVGPNYNGRGYKNNRIKEFDEIIEKFCLENALKYINLFGLLDNKDFYDGLHPNEFGHKKIFTKVKGMIL